MTSTDSAIALPDLFDVDGFWSAPIDERAAGFAAWREHAPVACFTGPDYPLLPAGSRFWTLTRAEDIAEASRTPEVFRSGPGSTNLADMPPEFLELYGSIISMDDPRHGRLRRIVARGFTPRRLDRLVDGVRDAARGIVDDIIADGECDAVTAISARLPLKVICDMMGVPESQYEFVLDRSNVLLGARDPEYAASVPGAANFVEAMLSAGQDLVALAHDLWRQRVADPTDDVTSALVSAEIDGERLTPDELAGFFILLVVAGNETTRHAITWGIDQLTRHPEQRAAWQADLDGVTPTAVEEIIRWSSPVIFMRRTLAVDTTLGGRAMSEGDRVLLFYWAANRDPARFHDPDAFDVLRSPNPHVGFGGPGPHHCLGFHLARREMAIMFRELLTRLPDIRAVGEPVRQRSMFVNGVKHLPVAFTPGRAR